MDGWQTLGGYFGGRNERREDAFRARMAENLQLGARDHALRQAVMKTEALGGGLGDELVGLGYNPDQARAVEMIVRAGGNPENFTGALGDILGQGYQQAARDRAVAGDYTGAQGELYGLAKGPLEMTKISDGTAYNPFVSPSLGDMLTTDVGQSTIRQRDAAAGASRASAAAAMGRLGIAQQQFALQREGRWDPSGAGTGTAGPRGQRAPSGYRWTADGALQAIPGGPADTGGGGAGAPRLTEGQSKDLVYLKRGDEANKLLETMGNNMTLTGGQQGARGIADNFVRSLPFGIGAGATGNIAVSSERQQAEQAGREFLSAVLRKDTGAAITAQEFEIYGETFLPKPGDSEATLRQKATSRQTALDAISTGLGPERSALARPAASTLGAQLAPSRPVTTPQRAFNAATGQTLELHNGQWVPVR